MDSLTETRESLNTAARGTHLLAIAQDCSRALLTFYMFGCLCATQFLLSSICFQSAGKLAIKSHSSSPQIVVSIARTHYHVSSGSVDREALISEVVRSKYEITT